MFRIFMRLKWNKKPGFHLVCNFSGIKGTDTQHYLHTRIKQGLEKEYAWLLGESSSFDIS